MKRLGVDAQLENGGSGQFDILVDGAVAASRTGGIEKKLTGGGWPDEEDVIQKLQNVLGLSDYLEVGLETASRTR